MASAVTYGSLPFREQLDFLRAKLPSADYWKIRGDAHDQAFVSAGATRADLIADLHAIVTRAIAEGMTLAEFREDYDAVLDHYGWEPAGGRRWRARVIYETNLRTSYAAGRFAQLQQVKTTRPYWVYNHSDAVEHPRELHLQWDGLAIHADNPWWTQHYPPNGWGCCCFVTAYSLDELKRYLGKSGPDQAPASRMRQIVHKGGLVQVPEGIDPGWNYTPGRTVFEQLVQGALDKTVRLPAQPAAAMNEQLLANVAVSQAVQASWSAWLDEVAADMVQRGRRVTVGSLSPSVVTAMEAAGVLPQTAAISVNDGEILHVLRAAKAVATTKAGRPKALSLAELASLPQILAQPQAVLLDVEAEVLLYVFAAERREAGKIVVLVNYRLKGDDRTNSVRSGSLIDWADVRKDLESGRLVLLEGAL